MTRTAIYWTPVVVAGLLSVLMAGAFMWAGWSYREWPYERQINGVLEDEVTPGGEYHATVSVIRTKSCPLRVHREFYDGSNTRIQSVTKDLPGKSEVGKRSDYQVLYQVPEAAKPGKGRVCVSLAPQCNVIQAALKPYLYRSCAQLKILSN